MWPLFLYRKHDRDRLEVDRRGVDAARRWGNVWAEADMHKRLGRVCTTVGRFAAADRHIRAAIDLCGKVGDARGGLDAREGLASLYRDTGREEEAAELLAEVLAANRELNEPRPIGLTLISLGMSLSRLGRPAQARTLLLEAKEVFADLEAVDPYNSVRVTLGLAVAYLGTGDLDAAERAAAEAERQMTALGSEHERAEALHLLGRVAHRRGDLDRARDLHRSALEIFEALGSSREADVRASLEHVGSPPSRHERQAG
jgi:tetratricopeptide (TPR) repeat protein